MLLLRGKKLFLYFLFYQICSSQNRKPPLRPKHDQIYGNKKPLIFNGTKTSIKEFPWLAQMLITREDFQTTCGGVVVSSRVIITAAHCVVNLDTKKVLNPEQIQVFLGSSFRTQGKEYRVCQIKKHPLFQRERFYYHDIALILVNRRIEFSSRVRRAKVIRDSDWRKPSNSFTVVGYGSIGNEGEDYDEEDAKRMRETSMHYVPNEECSTSKNVLGKGKMPVPEHMFCLIGESTSDCYGDSGTGVMFDEYVVGLVSVARVQKCGSPVPSMYVDLHFFREWLIERVDDLHTKKEHCNN